MVDQAKRIIRNYLILTGLYTLSASLIWGVNTLFLLDTGLNIGQVFLVNAVFTGSMALFEIPTGVLADTRGRRISFLLSIAILFLGTLGYAIVPSLTAPYLPFLLISVVLGLGFTFYSGAMEAWLVDALMDQGYEGNLEHVFSRSGLVTGAAMLVGSISGGLLGTFSLTVPYLVRALLLLFVFVVAARTMYDLGFEPRQISVAALPQEMKTIAKASLVYGWHNSSMRLLILASMVQSTVLAWGFFAWQPYFLQLLGQNAPWVAGLISALISLSMMAGNGVVELWTRYCSRRTTLLLWAAGIQSLAIIGVGLANSFWIAVPLYLLASAGMGLWGPVRQAYIHQLIPSEQRATVLSFDSLVGSGGSMVGQSSLGQLAQRRSFSAGYIVSGFFTLLALPIIFNLRRQNDAEDLIVGEAGKQGACAAQGMPAVAALDTQAGT